MIDSLWRACKLFYSFRFVHSIVRLSCIGRLKMTKMGTAAAAAFCRIVISRHYVFAWFAVRVMHKRCTALDPGFAPRRHLHLEDKVYQLCKIAQCSLRESLTNSKCHDCCYCAYFCDIWLAVFHCQSTQTWTAIGHYHINPLCNNNTVNSSNTAQLVFLPLLVTLCWSRGQHHSGRWFYGPPMLTFKIQIYHRVQ